MNGLLIEWIFIKFFPTAGRIGRKEYILGVIFDYIILFLLFLLAEYAKNLKEINGTIGDISNAIAMLGFLGFFIIAYIRSICWTIRRLHDLDRSGSHYFLLLLPVYNFFLIMQLICQKGTFGVNSHGPDPIQMIA